MTNEELKSRMLIDWNIRFVRLQPGEEAPNGWEEFAYRSLYYGHYNGSERIACESGVDFVDLIAYWNRNGRGAWVYAPIHIACMG